MIFGQNSKDEKTVALNIGVNAWFVKDYMLAARNYGYQGVESALLLLHHYNLKSVGVNDTGTPDGSLLKEMVVKMMNWYGYWLGVFLYIFEENQIYGITNSDYSSNATWAC